MSLSKVYLPILFFVLHIININAQEIMFYTGTTSFDLVKSVQVGDLDEENVDMCFQNACEGGIRPGYLAPSHDSKFIYAVSGEFYDADKSINMINAFQLESNGLNLKKIDSKACFGRNPCHISLSPDNKMVMWANYNSGDFGIYRIRPDGSFGDSLAFIRHSGSGPNKERQEMAHAHYITSSPDGKFIFVSDLGIDKIMIYTFNEEDELIPNPSQTYLELNPGSGPRHLAFHPDKNLMYILNELSSTLVACKFDPVRGTLQIVDEQSTLLNNDINQSKAAAIRIHPNGKYLYCSNRGENSIAVFSVKKSGKPEKIQSFSKGIGFVRDFNISPSGKYLIAGNLQANELVLLKVLKNGKLYTTGKKLGIESPSCIVFSQH